MLTVASKIPDLILMDLNLPGMNGFEALKQLQDKTQTTDIPVIAITATAMLRAVKSGLKAGFNGYVTTPIECAGVHPENRRNSRQHRDFGFS